VFLWWSDAALVGNKITANTSRGNTNGGLHVFSSAPVLTNNAIVGNQRGGIHVEGDAHPRLLHNTIADNGTDSVGMYIADYKDIFGMTMYTSVEMTNTILVSHTVGISITGGNTVTVNGLLWYNAPVTVSQSITAAVTLQNERWGAPAFAVDGYHITAASFARDAGVDTGVTTDIDGHHRPSGAAPDLGADEIIAIYLPLVLRNG
jgi:parallel beta-helix repeat protein